MDNVMTPVVASAISLRSNDGYSEFQNAVVQRFNEVVASKKPLFTTDAGDLIFQAYLNNLPADIRSHYSCNNCKSFVRRYGNLVTIDQDGNIESVMWHLRNVPPLFQASVQEMRDLAEAARVTGVLVTDEKVWGRPSTGVWHHLSVTPPKSYVFTPTRLKTTESEAAEKIQEHKMLARALAEINADTAQKGFTLLSSGQLFRGEKCVDQARWFHELHERIAGMNKEKARNLVWLTSTTAPAGFCHVRSSMLGTLLDDIQNGMTFDIIKKNFDAKMDPLAYRRAVSAPSGGQIREAERAVEELGIAPAFARRYLKDRDIPNQAILWTPSAVVQKEVKKAKTSSGVFDHLKPEPTAVTPSLSIPPKMMTWEKFQREVLPGAAKIGYVVPAVGRFASLTTAQDQDAPQILQWDTPDQRNTVAWSFPAQAARAEDWSLAPGSLANVRTIVTSPNLWTGNEQAARHGQGIFLLLEGAADKRGLPGGGLFTEHLRGDLAKYRAVIEAHMNKLVVEGADDPDTVGFGIGLMAGADWTEVAAPKLVTQDPSKSKVAPSVDNVHVILVIDDSGSMRSYLSAARTALRSLINAIQSMPGRVDVTVLLFGDRFQVLADQSHVSALDMLEHSLNGNSGMTALNDTIIAAITKGNRFRGANEPNTAFFLGIVTDGDENHSSSKTPDVRQYVTMAMATGRWTITYAGAGSNPRHYAREIGVPEGNIATFTASSEGFRDIGQRYSDAARGLGATYSAGVKSSTSFFGAASSRQAIGTDHPVLVVTSKSGNQSAYKLDRWD